MGMNSVNTNVGALVALQNLNSTSSELMQVQGRINTGKKVASAKDNGAIWAIAQNQRATSGALNAVKDSLQRTQSTIDVAISAGESISDILLQMKEKALAASDTSLDTSARQATHRRSLHRHYEHASLQGAGSARHPRPSGRSTW